MAVEAAYSCREALVGFTMASPPPNLVGRARRSRTVSSGGALPVSAGIKVVRRKSSRGSNWGAMSGVDLQRYENLCRKPWVKAA